MMCSKEWKALIVSVPLVLLMVVTGHHFYDLPIWDVFTDCDCWTLLFFQAITYLGESKVYLVVFGVLFVFFLYGLNNRRQAWRMLYVFSAIAVSGIAANLIKWLLGRWRPKMFFSEGLYGFELFGVGYGQTSFPSGHATTAWALAFTLSLLYPRLRPLWIALALLVTASRVVIGAHYTSDVVMGAYVGILTALLLWRWPFFRKAIDTKEAS